MPGKVYLHVDKHVIQNNQKTGRQDPFLTVVGVDESGKPLGVQRGIRLEWPGGRMIYDPQNRLLNRASAWVELDVDMSDVQIFLPKEVQAQQPKQIEVYTPAELQELALRHNEQVVYTNVLARTKMVPEFLNARSLVNTGVYIGDGTDPELLEFHGRWRGSVIQAFVPRAPTNGIKGVRFYPATMMPWQDLHRTGFFQAGDLSFVWIGRNNPAQETGEIISKLWHKITPNGGLLFGSSLANVPFSGQLDHRVAKSFKDVTINRTEDSGWYAIRNQ